MGTMIELPEEVEQRIDALVDETGRSKEFYIEDILWRMAEDIEGLLPGDTDSRAARGPRRKANVLFRGDEERTWTGRLVIRPRRVGSFADWTGTLLSGSSNTWKIRL